MAKIHSFVLKYRVTTIVRGFFRRRTSTTRYRKHNTLQVPSPRPLSGFFRWTQRLKIKAKATCSKGSAPGSGQGYVHIGQEQDEEKSMAVPNGHTAVYVGQKDGDYKRVLVPVIYFNHPLFSELLRDVENEFGFNHHGGITIPCRISEFERVQTRIKQGRAEQNTELIKF